MGLGWPVLHLLISAALFVDISFAIHVTIDILGSMEFVGIEYTICGYESLNEGDAEIAARDVTSNSDWILDAAVVASASASSLAWFVVDCLTDIATPLTENVLLVAIGAATVATLVSYGLLFWKAQESSVPLILRALTFLTAGLVLLKSARSNYGTANALVGNCCFTEKVTDYFGELWSFNFMRARHENLKVRSHIVKALAKIICAAAAFVIFGYLLYEVIGDLS